MLRILSFALCGALFLDSGSCFAPLAARGVKTSPSSLSMVTSDNDEKKLAASFLTAAYLFANAISVAPAFATPGLDDFAGSSQVVAAKSGGRMGGRSAMGTRGATPSYSKSSTVSHTTVIHQSPVLVAPPIGYGYGGYGYGGGLDAGTVGLTVGLSAINSIGREMREQSQERQIQEERAELNEARLRQAELEGRLRALEAAQRN